MSYWKLTIFILIISSGVSIALFTPAIQVVQSLGYEARVGIVPFTVIVLLVQYLLFQPLIKRLIHVDAVLRHLNHNQEVAEMEVTPNDILKPLMDEINLLIRGQASLNTMRGKLYEQISEAAAQEERNRLARDLHDSIKQQVFSMSISAAAAHAHLDANPDAAREALQDVKRSAQEAMVEMRALLQQLSPAPLEKSGLIQALRDQCEALAYRTGATVETEFGDLPPDDRLLPGTQEAIFRIAQEALSNIARHARAKTVHLRLMNGDETLTLQISDDGQGFDPQAVASGMGLNNIRSRAAAINATVTISSQPGTTITISIPLSEPVQTGEDMNDAQVKPIISDFYYFAGGIVAFLISASMITWRAIYRPYGIADDTFLLVIMAVLVILAVGSIPFALWMLNRAQRGTNELLVRVDRSSAAYLRLRRHMHMAYLSISTASGWFLPMIWLDGSWLPVFMGIIGIALVAWHYTRMRELYRAELKLLSESQRQTELDQRLKEIRSAWFTIVVLIFIVFITVLNGDVRIPPQINDHWMNTAFITLTFMLLLNQFISLVTYRRWKVAL